MEQRDIAKSFLGVGFKFPIAVDEATGRFKTSYYEEDIQEAIRIILNTRLGERVRHPDFGCRIFEYTFETMNYVNLIQMADSIKEALVMWEPRIEEVEVTLDETEKSKGILIFNIGYVVRSTNNPYNLVYPFYMSEGYLAEEE